MTHYEKEFSRSKTSVKRGTDEDSVAGTYSGPAALLFSRDTTPGISPDLVSMT